MCSKGRLQLLFSKIHKRYPKIFPLKKLFDIEKNVKMNLKKKEYDEKYERLLNQLKKEILSSKDENRRKYKFINISLENFSNHIPEHSNYITSKSLKLAPKPTSKLKIRYRNA